MWAFRNRINRWVVLAETMHAYHTCYISVGTVHLEKIFSLSLIWSQVLSLWSFFCPLSTNRVPVLVPELMPYMKPFCMLSLQKRQLDEKKKMLVLKPTGTKLMQNFDCMKLNSLVQLTVNYMIMFICVVCLTEQWHYFPHPPKNVYKYHVHWLL